ncbi:hypothetical protein [Marinospirillum perlucidum]|uniref:hypothetical protein n=1 Tax=Marinospirillum perlucidum TaxID=1982602 RepID=UPI000DF3334F|nr:hypothetical protein [Marinospirillum perlucidum]
MTATSVYDHLIIGGSTQGARLMQELSTEASLRLAVADRQLVFPQAGVSAAKQLEADQQVAWQLLAGTNITDLRFTQDGLLEARNPDGKCFYAKAVTLTAGASNLFLAHRMGYGLDYQLLPVSGWVYTRSQESLTIQFIGRLKTGAGSKPLGSRCQLLRLHAHPLASWKWLQSRTLRQLLLASCLRQLPGLRSWLLSRRAKKMVGQSPVAELDYQGPLAREYWLVETKTGEVVSEEVRLQPNPRLSFIFAAPASLQEEEAGAGNPTEETISSDK